MTRKEVVFDIEPVAASNKVAEQIQDLTKEIYGVKLPLEGISLHRYTTPRGTKLPKVLKKALNERCSMDRAKIDENWSLFTTRVAELYTKPMTLWAGFIDAKEIGSGRYDTTGSCFKEGKNNYACKVFMQQFRRGRVLGVERRDGDYSHRSPIDRPRARALIYMPGGRKFYLFNAYFRNSMVESYQILIQATAKLLSMETRQVLRMQDRYTAVPIYVNDNIYLVKDAKAFETFHVELFPCPTCGKRVPRDKFKYSQVGSTTMKIGCSKYCADNFNKTPRICEGCQQREVFGDNTDWTQVNNQHGGNYTYCGPCFSRHVTSCSHCSTYVPMVAAKRTADAVDDEVLCMQCYVSFRESSSCSGCSNVYRHQMDWAETTDGHTVCQDCADALPSCLSCEGVFMKNPGVVCAGCLPAVLDTLPIQLMSDRVMRIYSSHKWYPPQFFRATHNPGMMFPSEVTLGDLNAGKAVELPAHGIMYDMTTVGSRVGTEQRNYRTLMGQRDVASVEAKARYAMMMARLTPTIDEEPYHIEEEEAGEVLAPQTGEPI